MDLNETPKGKDKEDSSNMFQLRHHNKSSQQNKSLNRNKSREHGVSSTSMFVAQANIEDNYIASKNLISKMYSKT